MEKKNTLGNKGFSLVELIIVIAIMAILIAVLAPQYLKYVEKSRVSSDAATAAEFVDALQVAAADTDLSLDTSKSYSVSSATTGAITIDANAKAILANYMDTTATYKFQSSLFKAQAITITMSYDSTNKIWKITDNIPDTTTPVSGS